jgi:DNA-binding NtrC family response regulator
VRELRHSIERAVILNDKPLLRPEDFSLTPADSNSEQIVLDDLNLEEAEKILLRKALTLHEGNISKAAEALGITRTSLYRRMEKYGL